MWFVLGNPSTFSSRNHQPFHTVLMHYLQDILDTLYYSEGVDFLQTELIQVMVLYQVGSCFPEMGLQPTPGSHPCCKDCPGAMCTHPVR
jgi:hypothetical protein